MPRSTPHYIPIRRRENDYLIDRAKQKTETYTGIEGVSEQDACIQDSQGLIADRTIEHLGPTDMGVIRFRRLMLEAVRLCRPVSRREPPRIPRRIGFAPAVPSRRSMCRWRRSCARGSATNTG